MNELKTYTIGYWKMFSRLSSSSKTYQDGMITYLDVFWFVSITNLYQCILICFIFLPSFSKIDHI